MMTKILYLITICLPCATILLVFGMRYVAATQQARARLANDDAYRLMAAKATVAQSDTATSLASIQATLSGVETHLAAIERVLKAVE
jgi:hypothetical protein